MNISTFDWTESKTHALCVYDQETDEVIKLHMLKKKIIISVTCMLYVYKIVEIKYFFLYIRLQVSYTNCFQT